MYVLSLLSFPATKDVLPFNESMKRLALYGKMLHGRWPCLLPVTTLIPNSIVENTEFRLLIEILDPCYQTPGWARMAKEMDLLMADMKGRIKVYLNGA